MYNYFYAFIYMFIYALIIIYLLIFIYIFIVYSFIEYRGLLSYMVAVISTSIPLSGQYSKYLNDPLMYNLDNTL